MPFDKRVAVVGMGAVSPGGNDPDQVYRSLLDGRSWLRTFPRERFDPAAVPCSIGGWIDPFDPHDVVGDRSSRRKLRMMDPVHVWMMCATASAMQQAGLEAPGDVSTDRSTVLTDVIDPDRLGVFVGTGLSGRQLLHQLAARTLQQRRGRLARAVTMERADLEREIVRVVTEEIDPTYFLRQCSSIAAATLCLRYRARGPTTTLVTLCAASAQAAGEAAWAIRRGDADVAIVAGGDSMLNLTDLTGFCVLKAVTASDHRGAAASRPFDLERDGCVVSEGAAALVLEEMDHALARGTPILAELVGYGTSSDAYSLTAPPTDGAGAVLSMQRALAHARLSPTDIDHVNAHGTSTPLNDRVETLALKQVLGDHAYRIPVVSTKSMTGHAIAAAGLLEAVFTVQALRYGVVPPTVNLEVPDPNCDLDYVAEGARRVPGMRHALSNSFAIGGVNATLIFGKAGES